MWPHLDAAIASLLRVVRAHTKMSAAVQACSAVEGGRNRRQNGFHLSSSLLLWLCSAFSSESEFFAASPRSSSYPPTTVTSTRPSSMPISPDKYSVYEEKKVTSSPHSPHPTPLLNMHSPISCNMISIPSVWAELSSPNCQQQKLSKCPMEATPVKVWRISAMWQVRAA